MANGKKTKISGANKFEITILREQLLTDEETKEERRDQKMMSNKKI